MTFSAFLFQALNGLSTASGLFFIAAGLSLIFGVTRIVNIAHGSLYMLGTYIAYSFASKIGGALGFWGGIVATALVVGAIGALIEVVLLRRIYRAPELFQLLATFALVLVINDAALWLWGPEDLLGPRAPGLRGAIEVLGRQLPSYDLFLIFIGPLVLLLLHFALARTRFGRLVRAATQDREMVGALGVNQAMLFTAVFALGAALAGLGGALQVAREPANLATDLVAISDAFVVVVVGGMGSITGAYLAAVIIAEVKAICIGIGVVDFGFITVNFSKLTLVAEFLVMAVVLIARPYGLLGRPQAQVRSIAEPEDPIRPATPALKALGVAVLALLLCLPLLAQSSPYLFVLGIDVLIAVLFAASLHFIMGPGGMHSFGHAAYFGLGAYGAALLVKWLAAPMGLALAAAPLVALAGALLFGWFAVRLSGVYLAMLTLAFAQIVWAAVFQWEELTGGSNGVIGVWPPPPFDRAWLYFLLTLALAVVGVLLLRRFLFAPFGYAMRAGRDSRAARRGHRHRRQARALARLCHCRRRLRRGRRAVRLRQGLDLAGDHRRRPLHRRPGDGAARRHPDADRTDRRRLGVRHLAGYRDAADRILARAARRHHPAAGAGIPARHRRRFRVALAQAQGRVMSVLTVRSLSKAFGGVRAVNEVGFAVEQAEFLAMIGPNGAGKSTCFNMINGQLAPDSGEILFEGKNIAGLAPREIWRLGVGRTFQVAATFGSMTVAENVQMALISHAGEIYRLWRAAAELHRERALDLLAAGRHARGRRPAEPRARLWRRQARRARHRARQRAASAADGRADRRHGRARTS